MNVLKRDESLLTPGKSKEPTKQSGGGVARGYLGSHLPANGWKFGGDDLVGPDVTDGVDIGFTCKQNANILCK